MDVISLPEPERASFFHNLSSFINESPALALAVQHGIKTNDLRDSSSEIKTKFFKSEKKTDENNSSLTISAKDLWLKYVDCFPFQTRQNLRESTIQIQAISGVQYTVTRSTPLAYFVNSKDYPMNIDSWGLMIEMCRQTSTSLSAQSVESIHMVCALYDTSTTANMANCVTIGVKKISSLFHIVVASSRLPMLQLLLDLVDKQGVEALDPTQRTQFFTLASTSITSQELMRIGGRSFTGAQKFTVSIPPAPTDRAEQTGPEPPHPLGRQNTFTSKVTAEADLSAVPKWSDIECVWETEPEPSHERSMSPLELAFEMRNWDAWEALVASRTVQNNETSANLRCKLTLDRELPVSLANLQSLTSLQLCVTAQAGPVPAAVFELLQLRSLILSGSSYTELPDSVARLESLEVLDVSGMALKTLPVLQLGKLRKLTTVDCSGIPLASPPAEVVRRGPQAVARYILDLGDGAANNNDVLLMFIGDGEAGKTSTLRALKNVDTNCAGSIGVDDRTVGIDISSFQPDSTKPLRFFAWDFGGQGIYAVMQQLFVSRRALYPLLWRVRQSLDVTHLDASVKCDVCHKRLVVGASDKQQPVYRVKGQGLCHAECVSYEPLISSWTERLQFRVPGVPVVLIATHIDCATPQEVEEQCVAVQEVAERLLARQKQTAADIPALRIHNNGRSLRVNNMNGEGIAELRSELCAIAESLDFYGEVIPAAYMSLRDRLRAMQLRDEPSWRTWLSWPDYAAIGVECGLVDLISLIVATRFFHDMGELRYFDEFRETTDKIDDDGGQDSDDEYSGNTKEAEEASEGGERDDQPNEFHSSKKQNPRVADSGELLINTVFPNPFWVVDVLRGLIRHDHGPVLQLVQKSEDISARDKKILRRRLYRLMQRGVLHESLLSHVWHGVAGMSADEMVNKDEFSRLIALMKAFDILMDKSVETNGVEWVVPTLMAGKCAHTMDGSSFEDDNLPFACRFVYDSLPPYFDMILVAHIMNQRIADSVDFTKGAAAFKKLADRAQLFAGQTKVRDPLSVFRTDQACTQHMQAVLRPDQCHVVVVASTRALMVALMKQVSNLEKFFPGLRRLCTLFPCYSCRKQKAQYRNQSDDSRDVGALLAAAEAEDLALMADLQPYLTANVARCTHKYLQHKSAVDQLRNDYADVAGMFEADYSTGSFVMEFRECGLTKYYSRSSKEEHPERFCFEAMKFLTELVATSQALPDEDLQVALNTRQRAVEERQFEISMLQVGAELPTLRTLNKYCARHVDVLFQAWELCPELEVLCMSLSRALEEQDSNVRDVSIYPEVENMERADAAPEYMHLLRSVVDVMSGGRPQTAQQKTHSELIDSHQALVTLRFDDLLLLGAYFPLFQSADKSSVGKIAFLTQAYGAGTTTCLEEFNALFGSLLSELDTAMPPSHEKPVDAVRCLSDFAVEHKLLRETQIKLADENNALFAFLQILSIHVFKTNDDSNIFALLNQTDQLFGRVVPQQCGALQMHLFVERVEKIIHDRFYAYYQQLLDGISTVDSSFRREEGSSMKEFALKYFTAHSKYLFAAQQMFAFATDSFNAETWLEYARKSNALSFVSLLDDVRYAEKVLFLAQCVQKIDHYLLKNLLERLQFDEWVSDERAVLADVNAFYSQHAQLIWTTGNDSAQTTEQSDREYYCNVCRVDEKWLSEHFLSGRETTLSPFPTAHASLEYMAGLVNTVLAATEGREEYEELSSRMHAFENAHPITFGITEDELTPINTLAESVESWALGVQTMAHSIPVGNSVYSHFESFKEDGDLWCWRLEIYRTLSYIAAGKDMDVLPQLVKSRIPDVVAMQQFVSSASVANDSVRAYAEQKLATQRQPLLDICAAAFNSVIDGTVPLDTAAMGELVLEKMRKSVQETVAEVTANMGHFCSALRWKDAAIISVKDAMQNHINTSIARAQAHQAQRLQSVEQLRKDGALAPALKTLVAQSKCGLKTYTDRSAELSHATRQRVLKVVLEANERGVRYGRVMQTRMNCGPAWYFGGSGKPTSSRRLTLVEDFYQKHWDEDYEHLFAASDASSVEIMCPASFGTTVHETAQPKEPNNVLVCCSSENEFLAMEYLISCCSKSDFLHTYSMTCSPWLTVSSSLFLDFNFLDTDNDEQVRHIYNYPRFLMEENGRLVERASLLTGIDFKIDRNAQLCIRLASHNGQVRVRTDLGSVDGVIRTGVFGPDKIHVRLEGEDGVRIFCMDDVVSSVWSSDSKMTTRWKEAQWYNFESTVHIRESLSTVKTGTIVCPLIEVCSAEGESYGYYSPDQIVVVDDTKMMDAKVLICCIDEFCGESQQCQYDIQRAHDLGLGIIPVILPGYKIADYQHWWPHSMPALQHHSLFVDMRFCRTTEANKFWTNCLQPSVNVLFNEYVPRERKAVVSDSPIAPAVIVDEKSSSADPVSVTAGAQSGAQFVYCDLCAAVGTKLDLKGKRSGKSETGAFDRWHCQQLVGEWTAQELRRRDEFPDQPMVMSCPTTVRCSGEVSHEKPVRDVLSVQEKKTSYACPSCVAKGVLPPYYFDRDKCLAELEDKQSVSIMCQRCLEFIPQHELMACEVFLSYCWGAPECPACTDTASVWELKRLRQGLCECCDQSWSGGNCRYTTQRLVTEMKLSVQDEAGVMCWQDVDRLAGGKDLEREMEVGVQRADVIVIFLDDGYVRSANCRKEYLYSTKHGKYIIPVLLGGYSGGSGEKWWPESMASLSQFEPVLLREEAHMEQALQTICERIQSRFHRAQRYATADDAIAYLRDYSSWGVARKAFLTENLSLDKQEDIDAFVLRAFSTLDRDGDNAVDEAELAQFLDQNNLTLTPEQIAALIVEADIDGNGVLSLEELQMAIYAMIDERDRHNAVD